MTFIILECTRGKTKELVLITPQSFIIHNLCLKLKYKWAKENMKWIPKKKERKLSTDATDEKKKPKNISNQNLNGFLDNVNDELDICNDNEYKIKTSGSISGKALQRKVY